MRKKKYFFAIVLYNFRVKSVLTLVNHTETLTGKRTYVETLTGKRKKGRKYVEYNPSAPL